MVKKSTLMKIGVAVVIIVLCLLFINMSRCRGPNCSNASSLSNRQWETPHPMHTEQPRGVDGYVYDEEDSGEYFVLDDIQPSTASPSMVYSGGPEVASADDSVATMLKPPYKEGFTQLGSSPEYSSRNFKSELLA
jgi:hypothetical protein